MEEPKTVAGYRLSSHALDRMIERGVTAEEVLLALTDAADFEQADGFGLIHYQAKIGGRPVRVTVNALTSIVVTIVAPALKHANSPYGWFSLGASLQVRR